MSAYQHPDLVALDAVEDVLEAYAEARLSPSSPVLARMRAHVMADARARGMTPGVARAANPAATRRPWYRFSLPSLDGPRWAVPRVALALGFAVALGFGTSTAVLSAPPGSPFYNARVVLEDVFLPTDLDARLAAHTQHLDARLAEAEAAAARGDIRSLDIALAAYRSEVDAAIAEAGENYDHLVKLQAVLEKQVAKLEALAVRLPTQVARDNAAAHALQASERAAEKAVEKVKDKKAKSNSKPPVPPGQANEPRRDVIPGQSNTPSRPSIPPGQTTSPVNRPN